MIKTQELINKVFNKSVKPVENENVYVPRIKSTYIPENKGTFNEVFLNAHNQLKQKAQ